jgi:stage V sporulation protein R
VQLLTYDEISEVAAYGGFPVRYPHWSFGMQYEELQRGYENQMHKIYEMVINCCELDAPVLTKRGTILAGDVKVGDQVIVGSETRNVVAIKKQNSSQTKKIFLKGGQTLVCTPNHKWRILSDKGLIWKKTSEIISGDIFVGTDSYENNWDAPSIDWSSKQVIESTRPNIRHCVKEIYPPNQITMELAELLGILVGDGSVGVKSAENMLTVAVGKKHRSYAEHVVFLFEKVFGIGADIYEKPNCFNVTLCSKNAVDFVNSIGLKKGNTFKEKVIPDIIWKSPPAYRCAFIRGLFDTDGYVVNHVGFSCYNKKLADDVQIMLSEMGILSNLKTLKNGKGKKGDQKYINVVKIKGIWAENKFYNRIGFVLNYKQELLKKLLDRKFCRNGGMELPYIQQQLIMWAKNLNITTYNNHSLGYSIKMFEKQKVGINSFSSFVQRAENQGLSVPNEIKDIISNPLFVVEHVVDGDEIETVDIALDHDAHDFIAYGLITHNTSPCYIYCLDSNTLLDHLTVIAHATGHNDFFKNNIHFSATDTNMLNNMANHSSRIKKYMARWGKEKVTEFLDYLLRIDTLVDGASAWHQKVIKDRNIIDKRNYRFPKRLKVDSDRFYMDNYINTKEFKERENEKVKDKDLAEELGFFIEPVKDIFGFLRDNAPLKPWQQDIMSMIYEESIYFFPQRQTKVLNEGWACGRKDSLVSTNMGILTLGEIVDKKLPVMVYDGEKSRNVTNWFTFENRDVYRIETRRGYVFEGSNNHRIMGNNDWVRLDKMNVGEKVKISFSNIWTKKYQKIDYKLPNKRIELKQICKKASVTMSQVVYRKYHYKGEEKNDNLDKLLKQYDDQSMTCMRNKRKCISLPFFMDEEFASFVGYMIGDGHISKSKRTLGLTTGDKDQADNYIRLTKKLFSIDCKSSWDDTSKNGRYRISVTSKELEELLVYLGMKTGVCARIKQIPEIILKSPKSVIASFVRSYFDCDGYAGNAGVILSTASEVLSRQIQNVLLNFCILSTRRKQKDSCWHVRITGQEAVKYYEQIGFGLSRKQQKLKKYIDNHKWFIDQKLEDEIVSIEKIGKDTVYDITVETSHRYSACGFMNHNSMTDHVIMAEQGYVGLGQKTHDSGIIEYAAHKMGVLGGKYSTNPYKLGYNLLSDIRNRWDKGQFGNEWDDCTNSSKKEKWDTKAMLGKEKIFEVRKYYDDLTLIHEFFTEDFCREQEYFEHKRYPSGETILESHDYNKIKKLLMARHVNGGLPDIRLTEPNYRGKGYLMLEHTFEGRPLHEPYVRDVLVGLRFIWGNDVFLSTKGHDGTDVVFECFDNDPANVRIREKK